MTVRSRDNYYQAMERKNLLIALPGKALCDRMSQELLSLSSFSDGWTVHLSPTAMSDMQNDAPRTAEKPVAYGENISAEAQALDAVAVVDFDSLSRGDMATLSENKVFAVLFVDSGSMDTALLEYAIVPHFRFMPKSTEDKPLVVAAAATNLVSIKAAFSAAEKKTLRGGESFQNLLKALPDFVYVLDKEGNFTYLNEAARSFGYDPESLIGKHFTEILHKDDRPNVSREAVLARIRSEDSFPETPPKLFDERRSGSRMTRELEVRIIHGKTGEIIFGSVNAYGESVADTALYPLSRDTGFITMGAIRDVTALRLYQKSLEKNLAEKELLLREIHHRLRNNLQVIASLAHLREME
ncbi:MAG TPA: PAS domain S-box protein, partial [Rectinemataceae bacterium]|nr:PAS domain S-box protein [Rectinemataceae bacterium]